MRQEDLTSLLYRRPDGRAGGREPGVGPIPAVERREAFDAFGAFTGILVAACLAAQVGLLWWLA